MRQPILTQYCDGRQVQRPDWMTQWGSRALGEQGYSAIEILRYYYGDDMYINTAEAISGAYPALQKIDADGVFSSAAKAAVRKFQSIFGLPSTGIVDYPAWYKISEVYAGVSQIAELT